MNLLDLTDSSHELTQIYVIKFDLYLILLTRIKKFNVMGLNFHP
jgi:hypothetical protein